MQEIIKVEYFGYFKRIRFVAFIYLLILFFYTPVVLFFMMNSDYLFFFCFASIVVAVISTIVLLMYTFNFQFYITDINFNDGLVIIDFEEYYRKKSIAIPIGELEIIISGDNLKSMCVYQSRRLILKQYDLFWNFYYGWDESKMYSTLEKIKNIQTIVQCQIDKEKKENPGSNRIVIADSKELSLKKRFFSSLVMPIIFFIKITFLIEIKMGYTESFEFYYYFFLCFALVFFCFHYNTYKSYITKIYMEDDKVFIQYYDWFKKVSVVFERQDLAVRSFESASGGKVIWIYAHKKRAICQHTRLPFSISDWDLAYHESTYNLLLQYIPIKTGYY